MQDSSIPLVKVPISEARQKLLELVRRIKADQALRIQITLRGEVAAELRAYSPAPAPGVAAQRLRELMGRLPPHRGRKRAVSERVKAELYGKLRS